MIHDCKTPGCRTGAICQQPPIPKKYEARATTRERIAAGPKFEMVGESESRVTGSCAACDYGGDLTIDFDKTTGLCRPCWRAWRWSASRERDLP